MSGKDSNDIKNLLKENAISVELNNFGEKLEIFIDKSWSTLDEELKLNNYNFKNAVQKIKQKIISNEIKLPPNVLFMTSKSAINLGESNCFYCGTEFEIAPKKNSFDDVKIKKNEWTRVQKETRKQQNLSILKKMMYGDVNHPLICAIYGRIIDESLFCGVKKETIVAHHYCFIDNVSQYKSSKEPSSLLTDVDWTNENSSEARKAIEEFFGIILICLDAHDNVHRKDNVIFRGSGNLTKLIQLAEQEQNPNMVPWVLRSKENFDEFNNWLGANYKHQPISDYNTIIKKLS